MPKRTARKRVPYPCFVINMDRQPERLAEFREWNDGCGLEIERFPAIDGATLDLAARREVTTLDWPTPGMVGSSASHKRLWEHAVDIFRPVVVFEDDAVLRSDIGDVLPGVIAKIAGFWDIILLGFNTDSVVYLLPGASSQPSTQFSEYPSREELVLHRQSRDPVEPFRLANAFGVCGYVISPAGARKLLKICFPIDERLLFIPGVRYPVKLSTIDCMLNVFYRTVAAYVCLPPLVMTPNDQATSGTLARPDQRRRKRGSGEKTRRRSRLTDNSKPR